MSMLEPDHASTTRHRNVQRGRTLQLHEDRVAAFGAIRRALEVARRHDHKHDEYCAAHGESWTSSGRCESSAIRYAIRSAIGSDKT